MKATKIQDKNTKEIIMYYINGTRVSRAVYEDEIRRYLSWKVGCYNISTTKRTAKGNYKHVAYYSI